MRPSAWELRLVGACIAWLAAGAAASADGPRDLIREGNEHYAAGRYQEALDKYRLAAADPTGQSAEVLHDLAAAYFKLGQIEEARDLWTRVKESQDAAFEARTRYNLGNCDYADALAASQQDAKKALELLGQATDQYRTAVRLDPTLTDARANIELAQALRQQIEEQQQNQPQTQQSSSQPSDKQDQQPSTQPSSQPAESEQADQQDSEQQDSSTSQPAQSQPSQPQEQPESEDQEPEQAEQQEQPQTQPSPQTQPAQTQPAETQPAPPDSPQEGETIHLSREQAERLLQMIRDAEKARREKLLQQRAAKQKPVDRDW